MKLLRKKNGQWFTVSVAVGGLLLGATSMEVSASEAVVDSQEVSEEEKSSVPQDSIGEEPVVYENVDKTIDDVTDQAVENPVVDSVDEKQQYIDSLEDAPDDEDVDDSLTPEEVPEDTVSEEVEIVDETTEDVESNEDEDNDGTEGVTDSEENTEDVEGTDNSEDTENELDGTEESVTDADLPSDDLSDETTEDVSVDESQSDTHRNEIVNLERTWSEGYKGEGQVVAIIDSGLYIDHRAFQEINDLDRARYRSEEELNRAKEAAGIDYGRWFNEKIIFGHNYNDVNDELVELDYASHGTHVADSAVGNPANPLDIGTEDDPNARMHVHGVAPEAQLMFMRVFSDDNTPGSTSEYLYVQAIEDAVALGAQSINLSLGAPGGSQYGTTGVLEEAILNARRQGVSVVIAAGNEDSFGSGQNNPLVNYPDYGVVGTPSTSRDSISVAAVDSIKLVNEVLNLTDSEGNVLNLRINIVANGGQDTLESSEYAGVDFEYEYVGLGSAEDVADVDLTGKFALISRGELTFTEKAQNAYNAGAAGVIIFNNEDDGTLVNMGIDDLDDYPIIGVNYESGQALIENQSTHTLSFTGETLQFANPNAGELTDFTSWGLSADGELKPDLAAPGGNVYGAVNNDDYQSMGGTSMASPHVAGAVALLNQRLPEMFEGLEGEELSTLVKALLMSSARPHYNDEYGSFTSPRQQGAGLIDVDNALNSGIYLTGADGYPSISLRNVGDQFEFEINVYNISDEDRVLDMTTHLSSDAVVDSMLGFAFALRPRHLKDVPEGQLFLEANTHQKVTISVDAREFTDQLLADMPNGYFLEGFVSFGSEEDNLLSSIPFVGFRGDFTNLDVVEQPVYDYGFEFVEDFSDAPFYYVDMATGVPTENYTSLISIEDDTIITLGEDTVANFGSGEDVVLAISPDNDGTKDMVAFRGVFLRNYEDFTASVYHLNDLGEEKLVWVSDEVSSGVKNHFSSNPMRPKSTIELSSIWLGQDFEGNDVGEGLYRYDLTYRSQVPGSLTQLMSFNVHVSTTTPEATGADYDEETGVLTLRDVVDGYPGLNPYRTRISYGEEPNEMLLALGLAEDTREFFYLNGRDSYTFDVPEHVDLFSQNTRLYLEDFAGNSSEILLSDILHGESGVVEFTLTEATTGEDLSGAGLRVRIRDEEGNIIEGDRLVGNNNQNVRRLPFGTYTAELFLINDEYLEVVDGRLQTFVVSEDNSWQTIDFQVNYIERVDFRVDLNKELPDGGVIYLVDDEGVETVVPVTSYVNTVHQVRVRAGEYTIVVDLPEGFTSEQDGLALTIDSENPSLSVVIERIEVDRTELAELIELAAQVDRSLLEAGDSLVLDLVLENARAVHDDVEAVQSEVDAAATALRTQLETIEFIDPLANEKAVAQKRIEELDLLTQDEIDAYHNLIDVAETVIEIDTVVAEAEARQTQLEEELASEEALESARANAIENIYGLDSLSSERVEDYVDQVSNTQTLDEVESLLNQAISENLEVAELEELNTVKENALDRLESLEYLSPEERAVFVERIRDANSIEEIDVISGEALYANQAAQERAEEERLNERIRERELQSAKDIATHVISRLSALSEDDVSAYLSLIETADSTDDVNEVVNEAIAENESLLRQEALLVAKEVGEATISLLPNLSEEALEALLIDLSNAANIDEVNSVVAEAIAMSSFDDSEEDNAEETDPIGDTGPIEESETIEEAVPTEEGESDDLTSDDQQSDGEIVSGDSDSTVKEKILKEKLAAALSEEQSDSDGDIRLPDTATSTWALGLIGLSSLVTGVGLKLHKDD